MAILNTMLPTNLTEYPNSFKRQGAFPLERYSVFYAIAADEEKGISASSAYQEALNYARNNPIAYVGQVVSVVTVTGDAAAVDVYKIVQKVTETGVVHELELVGDAEAITAANAAIEGLASRIQAAEASITLLQDIVNGKGEGETREKGLTEKVAEAQTLLGTLNTNVGTNTSAIAALRTDVDKNTGDIAGHLTRIAALEDTRATKDEVATAKSEAIAAAKTEAENQISAVVTQYLTGDGAADTIDTLNEIAQWIADDQAGAAKVISDVQAILADYLTSSDKEALQGSINTVDGKFAGVNQAITDLEGKIGTLPEGSDTVVAFVNAAIDALKIGDYAKVSALNELAGTVSTLSGRVDTVAGDVATNAADILKLQGKLAGLGDTDTVLSLLNGKVDKVEGSRLINATEIAILSKLSLNNGQVEIGGTVAAGSVTGLPQRIADILDSTAEDEGKLLEGKVDERHLSKDVADLINGAVQTSSLNADEFETADNTLYIKNVNISKLTQDEGDWLILNGGDSTNNWN